MLNDGGASNVAALRDEGGTQVPVAGSSRVLSTAGGSAPAQVAFGSDGRVLIVTEKGTNRLVSWPVGTNDSRSVCPWSAPRPARRRSASR